MDTLLKSYTPEEVKTDESTGEIKAVFATLDVVDKQGDVLLPGSVKNQNVMMSAYDHGSWGDFFTAPVDPKFWPVGKGKVYEEGNKAIFEGKMFMDMDIPQQLFKLLKNMGSSQQWSMNLRNIKSTREERNGKNVRVIKSFKIDEVSPVFVGAGQNTRTLSVKGVGMPEGLQEGLKNMLKGYEEKYDKEIAELKAMVTSRDSEIEDLKQDVIGLTFKLRTHLNQDVQST